ncbi:ArfGap-domain-containing protein [Eremomyces bilateralis CBS 781.70]|uniref:ArfGap-domain-containing protein n=1 Tax=Eremomyces bilateralis CBS 781.70 TaxID=1392243 RepID=A0A6G1G320_9PEZI|nr:ArfGap-domain-containing protein [Eremomyces bilateralis CBS 781.70]KAF1812454.1 ArfGap-domain-containing protein [Eremomyces bilateralis CBS 781.70]
MAGKMWEVDPETRSKLLEIQKTNNNNVCVDCPAPSPQWASPKLGIFMCLTCSGIHRGLGVHISFVRSITMDAFKPAELARMSLGGNQPWRDFFDRHPDNVAQARTFDDCTVADRYDSLAAEEWRERLSCKVEGREFVAGSVEKEREKRRKTAAERAQQRAGAGAAMGGSSGQSSRAATPVARTRVAEGPAPGKGGSPALGTSSLSAAAARKAQNEAYFSRMGAENAGRSADLAPSEGGKYAGFGSDPSYLAGPAGGSGGGLGLDEFQKDPVAALSKGFGWLSTTVGKGAKDGYEGWVVPGMKKFAESDLSKAASQTALNLGAGLQSTTRTATESFGRFVEGEDGKLHPASSTGPERKDFWDSFGGEEPAATTSKVGPPAEKKDFWDEFAAAGETTTQGQGGPAKKSGAIGTAAMKKGNEGGKKDGDDGWGDW